MNNRLENILVECLVDTLSTIVCSESNEIITTSKSLISKYSIFKLSKAQSFESLKQNLSELQELHCLIVDGRCSFIDQFFSVMRQIPYWLPIILLTDSLTPEYLSTYGILREENETFLLSMMINEQTRQYRNQMKLIYSCPLRNFKKMLELLQSYSIKKKLFSKMVPDGVALESLKVLFNKKPITVEGWSKHIDLTPRKLQRVLKNFSLFSPKKIISLYHAYHIAFSTIDEVNHLNKDRGEVINAIVLDDSCRRRVMEYVLSRRSKLLHS